MRKKRRKIVIFQGAPRKAKRVFTALLKKVCFTDVDNETSARNSPPGVSGTLKINREYYIVFYSPGILAGLVSRFMDCQNENRFRVYVVPGSRK